ncbi:hypothetical protein [Clostridium tarantellae]|uniref:Uncharacterized protein n=1 Tax=Clostridium tarantellae TaxID=39493 RepID=A0A6I1MTZ8_9CLOT|nr:hypothetical protein [Clostridium tarantellae]MPQ44341.1 hypothetical protein [Clostridium tarantellae]
MNDKEIEKIQRYIYKNSYSKTGEELIQYIKNKNAKVSFTQEEWNKLLIPACSGMLPEVFEWLLNNVAKINENGFDIVTMIIDSQEFRLEFLKMRIKLLKILLSRIEKKYYTKTINFALMKACWFNNIYVVEFLLKIGANVTFLFDDGKTPYNCAKKYGERFSDYSLYNYIKNYLKENDLKDTAIFYSKKDFMGYSIYKI